MVISKWHGHEIIQLDDDLWIYKDTRQVVSLHPNRACGYCGKGPTKEGHDGCLGTLPEVKNACCGHGENSEAYVQFWNGNDKRGEEACAYFETLRTAQKESRT